MAKHHPELREFRAELHESQDGEFVIEGYAAVYGQWADIGGQFYERFMPKAFKKTIAESDVVALWNHKDEYPLARRSSGSLELLEDTHGLWTRIHLDRDCQYHRDAYSGVKNGLVRGMSIRFSVPRGKESLDRGDDGMLRRSIREARLFEVSPVTFPAYTGTEAHARAQECLERWGDAVPPYIPVAVDPKIDPALNLRARRLRMFANGLAPLD